MPIKLIPAMLSTLVWLASPAALAQQVRVEGNRLFVPIEINGSKTEALLDSAAEISFVDATYASRLSLSEVGTETARGTGGAEEVRLVEGVEMNVAGVELLGKTVAVLDLSGLSERLIGQRVDVIVGRELFDAGRFMLDIERGRFSRIERQDNPAGVRLRLSDHKGIKQFPVMIESEAVQADFDLGNGSEVLLGQGYASDHELLDAARIIGSKAGGGIGGAVQRDLIKLGTVTIAGVQFRDVTAAIDSTEGAADANVGISLLRHFVMIIDFPEDAVWLMPNESTK